mmetsp:Transcript_58510/g.103461  ORF Transcript_58510/g.103461 Transcript_58510/m.103461 type:complete len:98 (+) Transcript_58510:1124-1417(+)
MSETLFEGLLLRGSLAQLLAHRLLRSFRQFKLAMHGVRELTGSREIALGCFPPHTLLRQLLICCAEPLTHPFFFAQTPTRMLIKRLAQLPAIFAGSE